MFLLLFFLGGAAACTFCTDTVYAKLGGLKEREVAVLAALLALDGAMCASLLSVFVLPFSTAALGAFCAVAGSELMGADWQTSWKKLALLMFTLPLHFFLSGWSLSVAGYLRTLLHERGKDWRIIGLSLTLTLCTVAICALLLWEKPGALF